MKRQTHAVAKTRAYQVRWSSRCRSRESRGSKRIRGTSFKNSERRRRKIDIRLSSGSKSIGGKPQQRGHHALLRP